METAFTKNKSRIVPILERNLATVVPRLYSVGLISEQDRDVALIATVNSNTRAASLTRAVEGKVLNYNELLVFVYAVVSSTIEVAEKDFIKSLAYLPEHVTRKRRESLGESTAQSTSPAPYRRRSSDPMIIWKDNLESISLSPSTDTTLQSNEATCALPTTSGATNIPEPETDISQSEDQIEESVEHNFDEACLKNSSTWYKHARKFPGIKFSNYYTKQVVTFRGDIVKGEGVEIQIPGRAIKREDSVEFTIQACIDGPFELPEDVSLITPVYVISPHYEFQREVTVLMDSFSHLQSAVDLVFLTSPTKREEDEHGSHWKFTISEIEPLRVSVHRIRIDVPHFCLLCFGLRRRAPQYDYRVSLHSPLTSVDDKWCRAIFSVSLHHEVFIQNLKVHLDSFSYKFDVTCETPAQITQDEIIFQLPDNTKSLGFKIVVDKNKIFKSAVDRPTQSRCHKKRAMRDAESYPPRIALTVSYTREVQSPTHCLLRFKGISEVDSFNMTIPYSRGSTGFDVSSRMRPGGPNNDPWLTMSSLLNFNLGVHIPQEVGVKYFDFGTHLLQDPTGAHLRDLEHELCKNGEEINKRILTEWLSGEGRPVTWATLVEVLNIIGMGELAKTIEVIKIHQP